MKFFNFIFFAILGFGFAGTGQGIGNGSDGLESEEIADSVKQEVFLKTAEAEPIHLDRFKRFDGIGGGASPSRHSGGIGDGVAPRPGNSGIGGGASPTRGHRHGSSEIGDGVEPNRRSGIGGGAEPSHRSGIGSGTTHTRAPNKPEAHSGIGSGASSDWAPNKPRKGKWQIAENEDVSHIIQNDLIQVARKPRFSRDDRFDSGYNKDCNSYYGRLICYRIYSNPNIRVPGEMTCWRISGNRKNCTEIDNINYLRDEGYTAYESEVPRTRNHRPQQTEQITHGQDQYYDPYNTNQNYNGADRYPKTGNSQRGTHRFSTKALTLNDDSLEDDDTVELIRDKRKSGGKNTFRNRNVQRNRKVSRPVSSDPKSNPV